MASWNLEALTSIVSLLCESDEIEVRLRPIVQSYTPATGPADWCYSFGSQDGRHVVRFSGELLYQSPSAQAILDRFELDFYRALVHKATDALVLHAAALVRGDHCLVLAGASGSGKSTMTRALLACGWSYCTEEIVALRSATDASFLRRPLHLGSTAECLELPSSFQCVATGHAPTRWLGIPPSETAPPRTITAILQLQHEPGQPSRLERLSGLAALQRIWACRLNTGLDPARIASSLVSTVPCYELRTRDRRSALELVESIIR